VIDVPKTVLQRRLSDPDRLEQFEIPIEVITRHSVIFNIRTARAIGVTIPPELLKSADQVIE